MQYYNLEQGNNITKCGKSETLGIFSKCTVYVLLPITPHFSVIRHRNSSYEERNDKFQTTQNKNPDCKTDIHFLCIRLLFWSLETNSFLQVLGNRRKRIERKCWRHINHDWRKWEVETQEEKESGFFPGISISVAGHNMCNELFLFCVNKSITDSNFQQNKFYHKLCCMELCCLFTPFSDVCQI